MANIMAGKVEEVKRADYINDKGVRMSPVFLTVLVNDMTEEFKDDTIVTMCIRIEEPTWKATAMALLPGCFVKLSLRTITKRAELGYCFATLNWIAPISKPEYAVPTIITLANKPSSEEIL